MSYATYMQLCLSHPTEGYYMNPANAVIGARGDFITSPEISQAFGEARGTFFGSSNDDNEPSGGRIALGHMATIAIPQHQSEA